MHGISARLPRCALALRLNGSLAQGVTSLEVELRGRGAPPPTLDDVAAQVATAFAAHFGYPPPALPLRG